MPILSHNLHTSGVLKTRAAEAAAVLKSCNLCPRCCNVNRLNGELGLCATGAKTRIASYSAHFGEEQPLVGSNGSGTIFFASCSLHCCFCQNYEISHHPEDYPEVTHQALASIMLELQEQGCHNINLVTPTHVVPQIIMALDHAHSKGFDLPVIYNSSSYESSRTLQLLQGVIDIYLADFKFWNPLTSQQYAGAADYPGHARAALLSMHRQVGSLQIDSKGIARRGLIVRHLLMPDGMEETKAILDFISALTSDTYVNIMDQYHPNNTIQQHQELNQTISSAHYQQALAYARKVGLTRLDKKDLSTLLKHLIMGR